MKLNEEKCHFIVAGHKYEHIWANVGQTMIWQQNKVKLLGVNIDSKLSFNGHVTSLCVKAGRKLTALTRIARSLTTEKPWTYKEKRRILINAFVESQFNYCRLVWMFHSRKLNNKIKLQERSLRIIYRDGTSSFEDLLRKDGSVTVHDRNIQTLAVEMFKVKNNLSPKIIQDLFKLRNDLPNIRSSNEFCLPTSHTVKYGTESLRYLGPKIWNILLNSLKKSSSLYSFKVEIKK